MNKDEYIDNLILNGAIEVYGIDSETGEFLYNFTDKLKDVDPKAYKASIDYYESVVSNLWAKGFLSINMEDPDPIVTLTEFALNDEKLQELDKEELTILKIIMQAMRNN